MSIMNLSSSSPPQVCKVAFSKDMTYDKRQGKCPCECQKSITLCFPFGSQGCIYTSVCLCVCCVCECVCA